MSRTWKVVEKTVELWQLHRYPPIIGGSWEGIGKTVTMHNRQLRHAVKQALHVEEGEDLPTMRRNSARWDSI